MRDSGVDSRGLFEEAARDLRGLPVAVVAGASREGKAERMSRDRCACSRRTGAGGGGGSWGAAAAVVCWGCEAVLGCGLAEKVIVPGSQPGCGA